MRIERINRTSATLPDGLRESSDVGLRPIESLIIAPSESLDQLAARHARALPWAVRMLLRGLGAMNGRGSALTNYLLSEQSYTGAPIDLGYRDAMVRQGDVKTFLDA